MKFLRLFLLTANIKVAKYSRNTCTLDQETAKIFNRGNFPLYGRNELVV